MSKINQLQQDFYHNVFADNKKLDFISSDCPSSRFAVYQTTIFGCLVSALKITYPGVWQLLGDDCANAMARRFIKDAHNMPVTGCLDDWGADFSRFLRKQQELKHLNYLADYAKFEWYLFSAKMADDSTAIEPSILLQHTEEELSKLKINYKPGVYLLKSDYNIEQIYNYIRQSKSGDLVLSNKKAYILLSKNQNQSFSDSCIYWLKPEIWLFLFYTYNGEQLGSAVKNTEQLAKNFELVEALSFVISNNLLEKVE